MYAGHAALATFVKGKRKRIPIALLIPVAFAPDWIEWVADIFGAQDRMISHSLVSVGIGATVIALIYALVTRESGDAGWVWMTYVSHWAADFITGTKPTWPGGPQLGLMLYSRPVLDVVMESVLILLCWLVYERSLPIVARHRSIRWLAPLGMIAMQIVCISLQDPRA